MNIFWNFWFQVFPLHGSNAAIVEAAYFLSSVLDFSRTCFEQNL